MSNFKKNSIRFTISLGLAVIFLYLAFRGKNISQLATSLLSVPWGWFVLLFVATIISHLLRAWRWKYLLSPVKKNVSLRNVFSVTMIGYLINSLVPRLGELVRPYALNKLEGVSKSATMGTVVMERILDLITFALILLTVLFLYSKPMEVWFPQFANMEWLFFIGAVAIFVFFVLLFLKADMFFSMFKGFMRFLPQKWRAEGERIFNSFLSGFQVEKNPVNLLMIGLSSILIWLTYIVSLYAPLYIYNFPATYGLDFGSAAILQVASGIAFALPTPSGIGSYYLLTSFTLTSLFNVDPVAALSYAVYTHTVGFIATTSVGIYYFFVDKIHIADAMDKNEVL